MLLAVVTIILLDITIVGVLALLMVKAAGWGSAPRQPPKLPIDNTSTSTKPIARAARRRHTTTSASTARS